MSIDEPTPISTQNRIENWVQDTRTATHPPASTTSAQPITQTHVDMPRSLIPRTAYPASYPKPKTCSNSLPHPRSQRSLPAPVPSIPVYSLPPFPPTAPFSQPEPQHHPSSPLSPSHHSISQPPDARQRSRSLDLSLSSTNYNMIHPSSRYLTVVHPSEHPVVVPIDRGRDDWVVVSPVGQNTIIIDVSGRGVRHKKKKKRSSLPSFLDDL